MAKGKYEEWLEPDKLDLLTSWKRKGLSDEEIAKNIGISAKTLYSWMKTHGKICKALKKGKEISNAVVENAMYRKATGYIVEVKKPIKLKKIEYNDSGKKIKEEECIELATEEVYVPPDTTMQIYWSKNRMPERWKDKVVADIDNSVNINLMKTEEGVNYGD